MPASHAPNHIASSGTDKENKVRVLTNPPSMARIYANALLKSFCRPKTLDSIQDVDKAELRLIGQSISRARVKQYRSVCGFDPGAGVPGTLLQTLFVGLLGKYITSSFFPITPLGLIHTRQTMEQFRRVEAGDPLELSCRLHGMSKTQKGIVSRFLLEVRSDQGLAWQGISEFLTRSPNPVKSQTGQKQENRLKKRLIIKVPPNTGRQYASVSGDFNPHHLTGLTARLFGFSRPIAHGMWSLARVSAELEKAFPMDQAFRLEASFKRPVFLPAVTALGYEIIRTGKGHPESGPTNLKGSFQGQHSLVAFELRDAQSRIPHLKGLVGPTPDKDSY